MVLSNDQIQQLVKSRPHQREIEKGIEHQRRLRFHIETSIRQSDFNSAYRNFIEWFSGKAPELIAKNKAERIIQLIRPPIQTVELTESIFSHLYRVFFSQDRFFHYEFRNPELEADWLAYHDEDFWMTKGFQALQTSIDSVWCVDFPEIQTDMRPQPFGRLIDIGDVIDIKNDEDNNCLYFIYRAAGKVIAYDSEKILVYSDTRANIKNARGDMISTAPEMEIPHGLNYVPARMFWSEKLEDNNLINKESPITKELTDLDWLLLHMSCKRYMDLSNSFPITAAYEANQDYQDQDKTENKDRTETAKRPKGNKIVGPGTYITLDPPRDSTEADLMNSGPVKLINPDVTTLKHHIDEEKRLKDSIFKSVVGTDTEIRNQQPKNEMQIESSFESQQSVLWRIKRNFEIIQSFADSTLCRLRYGDLFINCTVDYGTNFFLKTVSDLYDDYNHAKSSGANPVMLSAITDSIRSTKYRNDKRSLEKSRIIYDLDPLPEKGDTEAIEIFKNGGVNKINFVIKTNLLTFVKRFERENINLVDFGRDIDYSRKIQLIQDEFVNYAKQQIDESQQST